MPDFEDPRRFLARHSLRPKDSFGQCFLVAEPVASAIVEAIDAHADETVIEIGTGCGTLARMIAPHARTVIAIERDRDLVAALRNEPIAPNVELVEADASTFAYGAVAARAPTKIVGNLPYQITGKLVRAILAPPIAWRAAVITVQKEVAARLLAKPGDDDWGVLSVFTSAACDAERIVDASPRCFHPAPRVTSTVVRLVPRARPRAEETPWFQTVVHTLFAARRKTVLNGLARVPGVSRDRAADALSHVGIDPKLRPETLTVEQLAALAKSAEPPGK